LAQHPRSLLVVAPVWQRRQRLIGHGSLFIRRNVI